MGRRIAVTQMRRSPRRKAVQRDVAAADEDRGHTPDSLVRGFYRSNLVESTIEEVVRSTPGEWPMLSITSSIRATEAVAATAIMSKSPLTECIQRELVSAAVARPGGGKR